MRAKNSLSLVFETVLSETVFGPFRNIVGQSTRSQPPLSQNGHVAMFGDCVRLWGGSIAGWLRGRRSIMPILAGENVFQTMATIYLHTSKLQQACAMLSVVMNSLSAGFSPGNLKLKLTICLVCTSQHALTLRAHTPQVNMHLNVWAVCRSIEKQMALDGPP